MQKLVWQNSRGDTVDLTAAPYGITEWVGFSNVGLNIQSQQVPFQDGAVFLDALMEQRELEVTLAIQDNNNLETRYQLRRELIHILNPKLGEGYLIYTNDFISKRIKCVPQIPIFETHNSNDSGTPKASLSWTACEPYWEDLQETEISIPPGQEYKIENEGDVDTEINCDLLLYGSVTTNPLIKNNSTNKKIELDGDFSNDIEINTKKGEKSVNEIIKNYNMYNFNSRLYLVYFSEQQKLIGFDERGNVFETKDLKKWNYVTSNGFVVHNHIKDGDSYVVEGTNIGAAGNATYRTTDFINYTYLGTSGGYGIVKNGNTYVSVGWNNVYVGTDLTNLTLIHPIQDKQLRLKSVTYSSELNLYCAVGEYYGSNTPPCVIISSDGYSWQEITSDVFPELGDFSGVVYAEGKFVVFSRRHIYSSSDGINWVENYTTPLAFQYVNDIVYVNGTWVVSMITSGKLQIITSVDSLSSFNDFVENENIKSNIDSITYHYLFYIQEIGLIFYSSSSSLSSFTLSYSDSFEIIFLYQSIQGGGGPSKRQGIYVNGEYLLAGGNYLFISEDGFNWNSNFIGDYNFSSICYAKNLNLYLVCGGGYIYASSDLINWSEIHNTSNNIKTIVYDKYRELIMCIGENGTLLTSSDANTWNSIDLGVTYELRDIAVRQDKILIIGGTNEIVYSEDGVNWLTQTIPNATMSSITCSDKCFCIPTSESYYGIRYSYDGINWVTVSLSGEQYYSPIFRFITYNEKTKLFYAIASLYMKSGRLGLFISEDLQNWDLLIFGRVSGNPFMFSEEDNNIIINDSAILFNDNESKINIIDSLTPDSNMNFVLKEGENRILSNAKVILTYRQKYIGV